MDQNDPEALLQAVQDKRRARKDKVRRAEDARMAVDLQAIDEIEEQLGDANVAVVSVQYVADDVPVLAAVKAPTPAQLKRFRDRTTPHKDGRNREVQPDTVKAAEELVAVCLVYPDKDAYERMCQARAGLPVSLGAAAVKLAVGVEEAEGK